MKNCTRCEGKGTVTFKGFTYGETVYPDEAKTCSACQGRKTFPEVDVKDILSRIIAKQGKNKDKLRAAYVSPLRSEGVEANRAYFVWRLARFHGGKDMTMPVVADMIIGGDPFKDKLDEIASALAKHFFGTDLAAALVWGRHFGLVA